MAVLNTSFFGELPNEAWVIGDKGRIHVYKDFQCAQKVGYQREDDEEETIFNFPDPLRPDQYKMNFVDSQLMKYECIETNECIRNGLTASKIHTPEESLAIAKIMDEVRKQVGVQYEADRK